MRSGERVLPSRHLLVQSQHLQHQSKVWNLFKVDNFKTPDFILRLEQISLLVLVFSPDFTYCWRWTSKWRLGMCLTRYMAYLFWSLSDIPQLLSGLTQAIPKLGDKELREEGACEIWEIFSRCGVEIGSKLISKRNGFLYCIITFDFMKYSHHLFQQFLETFYKQSFRKFLCPRLCFEKLCYAILLTSFMVVV